MLTTKPGRHQPARRRLTQPATAAAASAAASKTSEANADALPYCRRRAFSCRRSQRRRQTSAARAGASETAAKTSETQAVCAGDAGVSHCVAVASEKAFLSAAEAKTSETNAATSAVHQRPAQQPPRHQRLETTTPPHSIPAHHWRRAAVLLPAATRAEDAAKRAEDIADVISLEDASLTKKGIVKLSSATDSDSEALAAAKGGPCYRGRGTDQRRWTTGTDWYANSTNAGNHSCRY